MREPKGKPARESFLNTVGTYSFIPTYLAFPLLFFIWRGVDLVFGGGDDRHHWVSVGYGSLFVLLQMVIVAIVLGLYWVPAVSHLIAGDGERVRPAPLGLLLFLVILPVLLELMFFLVSHPPPPAIRLVGLIGPAMVFVACADGVLRRSRQKGME